jgi:uncharacterized membrane protein YccF (DUF307 family)
MTSSISTTVECRFTKLVILLSFVLITQDFISFGDLNKLLFCLWVILISVWMILKRELSKSLLDFTIAGSALNTKDFVVIRSSINSNQYATDEQK